MRDRAGGSRQRHLDKDDAALLDVQLVDQPEFDQFDRDLEVEPQRVRGFYEVRAKRVEPVGLVYLWPEAN